VQPLSLVVLAAGIGSRFGGTKQLAAVGPSGEAILDYTITDARRAGFERFVLVIRHDLTDLVVQHLQQVHGSGLDVRLVYQDDLGPSRERPWGTGHAVLAARPAVDGPFGVVNADDFYGRRAFEQLAGVLRGDEPANRHHLVAYRLAGTLSASGTVSRGVCTARPDGSLQSIEENLAIARDETGQIVSQQSGTVFAPDTPVSMNLWGLRPSIFDELQDGWDRFRAAASGDERAEFQLPTLIDEAVAAGRASGPLELTDARWIGVTYPDDIVDVRRRIAELVTAGEYPTPLPRV
jgi:NDP-sugar pyrophosphorylase family protein